MDRREREQDQDDFVREWEEVRKMGELIKKIDEEMKEKIARCGMEATFGKNVWE